MKPALVASGPEYLQVFNSFCPQLNGDQNHHLTKVAPNPITIKGTFLLILLIYIVLEEYFANNSDQDNINLLFFLKSW